MRPVSDPQTVNLSDGATHVGGVALVGNLKGDVIDPRRRTRLADSHFLDQRLKGPELNIDLAKRAFGLQLEPGSE
jgi:hypothetical protein